MDISTVIGRETKSVFLVGKGHLVNDAWKTGLVLAVLHTVCLKTVTSLDITSKLFHVQFAQMCEVFQGVFYFPCKCSCRRDPKSKIAKTKKFSYLKRSLATVSGCLEKQVSSIVPSFIHYAFRYQKVHLPLQMQPIRWNETMPSVVVWWWLQGALHSSWRWWQRPL